MSRNYTIEDLYPHIEEYDLICSLGANCSTANELKRRGLRQIALPFDWTWFNSSKSIKSLQEGFQTNFSNFMIKENLRKLENEEYSSWHSDRWQYEDLNTGVKYFNHFYKLDDEDAEKQRVISIFRKRCKRFDYLLQNSKRVLLILSVICDIDTKCVQDLLHAIQKQYPSCEVHMHFQAFNCPVDECYEDEMKIVKYKRPENTYDYLETNFEWRFLDKVKLSDLFYKNRNFIMQKEKQTKNKEILNFCNKIIKIWKLKRGMGFGLFPICNTIFYIKFYVFGIRLHFCIGKDRTE